MGWNSTTQLEWIVKNLGPTLDMSGYEDLVIMMYDDQRPWAVKWAKTVKKKISARLRDLPC